MKNILTALIIYVFTPLLYSQEKQIDWDSDLDFLAKELPEKHYNFFTKYTHEEFLAGIKSIKYQTKELTDFEVALKMQQLIAKFGDSHTTVGFVSLIDKNKMLPFQLYYMSDGLPILHTTKENEELLGCRLLSINNVPIQTVIDSLSTLITADNQASIKQYTPQFIPSVQILKYFGFLTDSLPELEVITQANEIKNYALKFPETNQTGKVSFQPDSVAFSTRNQSLFFTDCYYPDDKIYYMQYNRCWSKEIQAESGNKEKAEGMPSFKEFEEKAFNTLENEAVEKIVFDMRYNGGGNSLQGSVFIQKLSEFLKKNPHIKTYVVIGRNTFSSAILNTMDFKQLTDAILVGEETTGKPNHFGEVKSFRLPSSKLYVNYSTKYFKRTDEDLNTITPDVLLEISFSDFSKGIDPVFEWIKNQ